MTPRVPRLLLGLGGLLVVYLGIPLGAFLIRVLTGHDAGWHDAGLWSALGVSLIGASAALLIGIVLGIPLAYGLARRRGPLAALISLIVSLPLAVPPLISGVLLIYVVGPYTFLGRHSGQRLTQTIWGVIIAMSYVSVPFLVITARSAFAALDPGLEEVAATLGHGRLARFLRVAVPGASGGLRAGMVLLWLRAFGEYGTVVVLAYHPYSLPVYVENLFSSAPLSEAEAPTLLAFAIAILALLAARVPLPRRRRHGPVPEPAPPPPGIARPVAFAIDTQVGDFRLAVSHRSRGHRLALIGASGAGKSLTLRGLAGLLGPGSGSLQLGGRELSSTAPETRRVGYVPQGYGLLAHATVFEQVTFGVEADPARAMWWLSRLGIDDLLERRPRELSGGQRQRVSLARALAPDPQLLLLDEPFSALDAPVRQRLRRELRRLQQEVNLSTVLVSHDPEEAVMLADDIVVIENGQVLAAGPGAELLRRPPDLTVGRLLGVLNLLPTHLTSAGQLAGGLPAAEVPGPVGGALLWRADPEGLSVRPPSPATDPPGRAALSGRIGDIVDLGVRVEVTVILAGGAELLARTREAPEVGVGGRCRVEIALDAVTVWAPPARPSDMPEPLA